MHYRRRMGTAVSAEVWHWRSECTHWPTSWYTERQTAPTGGEACPECEAIECDCERLRVRSADVGTPRWETGGDPAFTMDLRSPDAQQKA
jgi:hypothetical protein